MNKNVRALPTILFFATVIILVTIGCSLTSGLQGGNESVQVTQESSPGQTNPQPQPEQATTAPEQPAQSPTATQEPAPTQAPAEAGQQGSTGMPNQSCLEGVCVQDGYFLLDRPVGGNGRKTIDHANRDGTYRLSSGDSCHGVFFLNSTGIAFSSSLPYFQDIM